MNTLKLKTVSSKNVDLFAQRSYPNTGWSEDSRAEIILKHKYLKDYLNNLTAYFLVARKQLKNEGKSLTINRGENLLREICLIGNEVERLEILIKR